MGLGQYIFGLLKQRLKEKNRQGIEVEVQESTFSFRPMEPGDLPQVLAIENEAFPSPWSEQSYRDELSRNAFAHYFALVDQERVVGYAGMWIILDEAHVTTIAVHSSLRGRGLGRALMEHLMAEAINWGADRITLEVRASNEAARKLYTGLGFQAIGLRKGYYADRNEDAVVMGRNLLSDRPLKIEETDGCGEL